jgi:hypothetical protein
MRRLTGGMAVVFASLFLCMTTSCGLNKDEIAKVYKNLANFHQAMDKGNYSFIIQYCDVEYKKSSQQDDLIAPFQKVHEKYGKILSSEAIGYDVHNYIGANKITLHQKTAFEKGVVQEDLTYMFRDHEPFLLRYEVRPIAVP